MNIRLIQEAALNEVTYLKPCLTKNVYVLVLIGLKWAQKPPPPPPPGLKGFNVNAGLFFY